MPLLHIMASLFFIIVAWWSLQALKVERFLHRPTAARAKLLLILLSIVIGTTVARFFIDYLSWFTLLRETMTIS